MKQTLSIPSRMGAFFFFKFVLVILCFKTQNFFKRSSPINTCALVQLLRCLSHAA